jgi:hypothetical protein
MIGTFTEWINENKILLDEASADKTGQPVTDDDKYSTKIMKILRNIEKKSNNDMILSYGKSGSILRFTVNKDSQCFGVIVSGPNDRKKLYDSIIAKLSANNNIEIYKDNMDDMDINPESIYIRSIKRDDQTIEGIEKQDPKLKATTVFSSAGGIEFYDAKLNKSILVEFELTGSARSDSAVNTKLREITPCILFEIYCKKNLTNNFAKLNKYFQTPSSKTTFETIKKDILKVKFTDIGCDVQTLNNVYNFDYTDTYKKRIEAFGVGVKTLQKILETYNTKNETVVNVKYTGLDTMAAGGEGSTEDILVVTQRDNKTRKEKDIKISLKSGPHKIREPSFESLLRSFNIPGAEIKIISPDKKTKTPTPFISKNTLYISGTINKKGDVTYTDKPQDIVNTYLKLLLKLASDPRFNTNITKAIINWMYPDPTMEVWNITEKNFEDLKPEFDELLTYNKVKLIPQTGTKCTVLEFYNNPNDKFNKFRMRWYKRDGANTPGQYKMVFENNPKAKTKK